MKVNDKRLAFSTLQAYACTACKQTLYGILESGYCIQSHVNILKQQFHRHAWLLFISNRHKFSSNPLQLKELMLSMFTYKVKVLIKIYFSSFSSAGLNYFMKDSSKKAAKKGNYNRMKYPSNHLISKFVTTIDETMLLNKP